MVFKMIQTPHRESQYRRSTRVLRALGARKVPQRIGTSNRCARELAVHRDAPAPLLANRSFSIGRCRYLSAQ
jgi:hypothetical protein